jgi:excisionase family DNA binding protein
MSEHKINSDAAAVNQMPVASAAPKLLFNISEAAEILSVSVPLIRRLIRQQRLKRVRGVRKVLIPAISLQNFAASAE